MPSTNACIISIPLTTHDDGTREREGERAYLTARPFSPPFSLLLFLTLLSLFTPIDPSHAFNPFFYCSLPSSPILSFPPQPLSPSAFFSYPSKLIPLARLFLHMSQILLRNRTPRRHVFFHAHGVTARFARGERGSGFGDAALEAVFVEFLFGCC